MVWKQPGVYLQPERWSDFGMESQEGVGSSGWLRGNKKACSVEENYTALFRSSTDKKCKCSKVFGLMRVLVSAGCLCDGWRENPGAGRPGLQRNGHPSRQAGPLHGLRRHAAAAVPACHAGRGNRQWGENQESSHNQELSQHSGTIVLLYSELSKSPAFRIAFHTFNGTWQHEQLPPQLSRVTWN